MQVRLFVIWSIVGVFSAVLTSIAVGQDFKNILAFEVEHTGQPRGWSGRPQSTIHVDGDVVHGGKWAARLERDINSPSTFTTITKRIPVEFVGERLQLKGFVKSKDVEGYFGLWLREDDASTPVQFDNMANRRLKGTTDWTEYTIDLPLDRRARHVLFGALVSKAGTIWVDDIQLLVDGVSVDDAPRIEQQRSVVELDQEFDRGSGVTVSTLSDAQLANLDLLGRIWGFLKYHHPAVTGGEYHWDYELFRVLPTVLAAEDSAMGRAAVLTWVLKLGEPPACKPCAQPPTDTHFEADLEWLDDEQLMGAELQAFLKNVYRNRHAGGAQFYVHPARGVGNALFENESRYGAVDGVDAGYRILALFRFWNIVQYWYPYRNVIGQDWNDVLPAFLERFVGAEDRDGYNLALIQLIAQVNDTHCNLWSAGSEVRPPRGGSRLPVNVRFVGGRAVVCGLIEGVTTPLQLGDVITEIDGTPVAQLIEDWAPFYPASNEPTRRREMARSLTGGDGGPCTIRVERANGPVDVEVVRRPVRRGDFSSTHDRPGETFQMLSDDVAYLKLSSVKAANAAEYVKKAEGARGLVIDIRNYPSEFMVFALGRLLVGEPTEFARFTKCDISNPGAFTWTTPVQLIPRGEPYQGKLVILIDEVSQSQAEYTTMAFRSVPGAVVVGSTTAGADGNASWFALPGGERSMISGIGVFYPDKTPTQRIGIVADVVVRPTLDGIRAGRDEVLEEAVRQVLGGGITEDVIIEMTKH